jgi:hypothetical protein
LVSGGRGIPATRLGPPPTSEQQAPRAWAVPIRFQF